MTESCVTGHGDAVVRFGRPGFPIARALLGMGLVAGGAACLGADAPSDREACESTIVRLMVASKVIDEYETRRGPSTLEDLPDEPFVSDFRDRMPRSYADLLPVRDGWGRPIRVIPFGFAILVSAGPDGRFAGDERLVRCVKNPESCSEWIEDDVVVVSAEVLAGDTTGLRESGRVRDDAIETLSASWPVSADPVPIGEQGSGNPTSATDGSRGARTR